MEGTMESKLRLKIGPIEVEHEGSDEFPSEKALTFIEQVLKLMKANNIKIETKMELPAAAADESKGVSTGGIQGTCTTIAAKIGGGSGPDLVMVAAARLTFVLGQSTFSRQNILEEMKTAAGYYKKNFSNNLSKYLQGLVKSGKLNETATDTYSLSENAKKELEGKLAG
jgi:hypothetical protein